MNPSTVSTHVGRRYTGRTNRTLVAGRGKYVDDIRPGGELSYMAVLRSPHAHAAIRSIDTSRAAALPGVLAVVTGTEIAECTKPIPQGWDTAAVGAHQVEWYALCVDRARYVGEAVAAVVAETRHAANLALGHIDVDYEPLPAATDVRKALDTDAPLVEPSWGSNVLVRRDLRVGDAEGALAGARGTVETEIVSHRGTGVPIEPRGLLASFDRKRETLTLWDSTQNPHPLRVYLSRTLGVPESRIRVIQPRWGVLSG